MSNKKQPMITPTTIALDNAAALVQDNIDYLHDFAVIDFDKDDILNVLARLKQDILDRKPPNKHMLQQSFDSWRASPDRMCGQFTTEEINEDLTEWKWKLTRSY